MSKCCFVDTTLLVEALLKTNAKRAAARAKIKSYEKSILPIYAIKEFKAGPLRHFMWAQNKLADTRSLRRTLAAIQMQFRKPYLQATALEALRVGAEKIVGTDLKDARTNREVDEATADAYRLAIRYRIKDAWNKRRKVTTDTFDELAPCFIEELSSYDEATHFFQLNESICNDKIICPLGSVLRENGQNLESLLTAIKPLSRSEDNKRRKVLHLLKNTPRRTLDSESCRALGDAYFALRCPAGCSIVTSNNRDHEILAGSIGKIVDAYSIKDIPV